MASTVQTNYHQRVVSQKKEKKNIGGAVTALVAASLAQSIPQNLILPKIAKEAKAPNLELSEDQIAIVNDGVKKVFNEIANLSKKGVKLNDYQTAPVFDNVINAANFKKGFDAHLAKIANFYGKMVANGDNAFF